MKKERVEEVFNDIIEYQDESKKGVIRPAALLLDSSLITETNLKEYDAKVIVCGDYVQVYKFRRKKLKDKDLELFEDKKKIIFDEDNLYKVENYIRRNEIGYIEYKNIIRSRNQLTRLIMANEKVFKTFITLTFESADETRIKEANKKFHSWCVYIKRKKRDFSYVCVPEYQKRGVVHYHLLTNLVINKDSDIIIPQKKFTEKALKKLTEEQRKCCYDIIGWNKGFVRVDKLNNIDVTSYLTKYMTKDYDHRLYGHRRYMYSMNLKRPLESNLDLSNYKHYEYFEKILNRKELKFNSSYVDYFGDEVNFFEFRSQHNMYYTKSSYIQFII